MMKNGLWIKVVIVLALLLVVWIIFVSSKQIKRSYRIEEEVAKLQSEADTVRHENATLSEKIAYFSSDNFREQEAKQKLGLKKAEENVVVIVPRPESLASHSDEIRINTDQMNREVNEESLPNYKKWWRLFFSSNKHSS